MFWGMFFDHMFDHLQNWSTWRQEYRRARFDNFCVPERSKRSRNAPKMVNFAIRVAEIASLSLLLALGALRTTRGQHKRQANQYYRAYNIIS